MEPIRSDIVVSAARPKASHKRRAAVEREMRLALTNALAPVVSAIPAEQVRIKLGDSEQSIGQLRHDIGHVKARRTAEIGMSRLLFMCERLNVNAWEALSRAAPRQAVAS